MAEIPIHDTDSAPQGAGEILERVEEEIGFVPNMYGAVANDPATLQAYAFYANTLDEQGGLSEREHMAIALACAQENDCHYCKSSVTALAREAGLSDEEILALRRFDSSDRKLDALASFARKVAGNRAELEAGDLQELRDLGYDDGDLVEIHGQIMRSIWTNYFNRIFQTDLDLPEAPEVKTGPIEGGAERGGSSG